MMKDIAGNKLEIGDLVSYMMNNSRKLCIGIVVGFTPKKVNIARVKCKLTGTRANPVTKQEIIDHMVDSHENCWPYNVIKLNVQYDY